MSNSEEEEPMMDNLDTFFDELEDTLGLTGIGYIACLKEVKELKKNCLRWQEKYGDSPIKPSICEQQLTEIKGLRREQAEIKSLKEDIDKLKSPETHSRMMDDYIENYLDDKGLGGKDLDEIIENYHKMEEECYLNNNPAGEDIPEDYNLDKFKELKKEIKELKEEVVCVLWAHKAETTELKEDIDTLAGWGRLATIAGGLATGYARAD